MPFLKFIEFLKGLIMQRYPILINLMLLSLIALGCKDEVTNPIDLTRYEIVYVGSDFYLYTMKGDGSGKSKFFDIPGFIPQYSPDGEKISCFWYDRNIKESWIVTFDIKNGDMEKIAFIKGLDVYSIDAYDWSSDGNKIVFNKPKKGVPESDICVVDVHTKEVKQLTNDFGYCFDSRWSPDQKQVFFLKAEPRIAIGYQMNADGSDIKPALGFPRGSVLFMDWSPDGSKIIFGAVEDSTKNGLEYDLYIYDVKTANVKRITFDGKTGSAIWSPRGDLIAFYSIPYMSSGGDYYVMNADGSNQKKITSHSKGTGYPYYWSPDVKKFYMLRIQEMDLN